LSKFAGKVRDIIENEGQGSLIYSGGDDVLAFVGLHKVLDYVDKLAKDFESKLKKFEFEENGKTKSPTLSVGIAVVHHLEPLEDALELVRKAEKAAKSVDGKNALAVVVDKRSGTSRIAKGRWGTLDERLETFIRWHRENAIPDGAAYELRDLAYRLEISENAPEDLRKNLAEAKEKEAKRILKRKKKDFGESVMDDATIEKLHEFIEQIEATKKDGEDSIAILADELIIAKIFAEAEKIADGD
jgi:CRISPR-associated protein Cmr2